MGKLEVRVQPIQATNGRIRVTAQLHAPVRTGDELWYELDEAHRDIVVERSDPFIVAALLLAMGEGLDLHVRGAPASTSLLRNLDEFQQVWHAWFGFPVIDVVAEDEREDDRPEPAVLAFSGGVDSVFSVFSHSVAPPPRSRNLRAALMIHGIDVELSDATGFGRAIACSRKMLDDVGLPVIAVATNAWELNGIGDHFTILGVASALHAVGGGFGVGLVSSTASYGNCVYPLDSTPASDPLLGGSSFEIVHYGSACDRLEKLRRLAQWDAAIDNLRVCLFHPDHDGNCGSCHKCLITYMSFRVLGIPPRCFEQVPSDELIMRWSRRLSVNPVFVSEVRAILAEADARGIDEPWTRAARHRLRVTSARESLTALAPSLSQRAFGLYARRPRRRRA